LIEEEKQREVEEQIEAEELREEELQ